MIYVFKLNEQLPQMSDLNHVILQFLVKLKAN